MLLDTCAHKETLGWDKHKDDSEMDIWNYKIDNKEERSWINILIFDIYISNTYI